MDTVDTKKTPMNSTDLDTQGDSHADNPGTPVPVPNEGYQAEAPSEPATIENGDEALDEVVEDEDDSE